MGKTLNTGNLTNAISQDASNNIGIGTTAPLSKLGITGNLSVGSTYGAIAAPTSGAIIEGNVGIGISAPSSAHKVSIADIGTNNGGVSMNINKTGVVIGSSYGIASNVSGAGTTNVGAYLSASGATNNYALVVPSTGGNVGIGTTAPTDPLHVVGSTTAGLFEGSTQGVVGLKLTGATTYSLLSNATGMIGFYRGSGSLHDFAIRTGNIGIGYPSSTTTYNFSLGFGNQAARTFGIEASATDVIGRRLTMSAGSTVAGTSVSNVAGGDVVINAGLGTGTGTSNLFFQTGTTLGTGTTLQTLSTKMFINGAGNVGIGTTSPDVFSIGGSHKLLTVTGSSGASSGILSLQGGATGTGVIYLGNSTPIAHGAIGSLDGSILAFYTNTTNTGTSVAEKMRITSSGNVGIGTATPTAVLHLKAGTATLNTAPLKFTSGALNTTAEAGAVEFLTDAYYGTITTGAARKTFAFVEDNNIFSATVSLTSAQILTLNTTPITIVAAPGAGKYIEVISATGEYTFITAAYNANTVLQLINTGATNPIAINQSILTGTVNLIYQFNVAASTTVLTATQVLTNTALQVKVQTGNPSLGSGTVKIKVLYRIVTI